MPSDIKVKKATLMRMFPGRGNCSTNQKDKVTIILHKSIEFVLLKRVLYISDN